MFIREIIGFKCNTPTACNIMPSLAHPVPAGLIMKFTKTRVFYHARVAVTRYVKGLTSNTIMTT